MAVIVIPDQFWINRINHLSKLKQIRHRDRWTENIIPAIVPIIELALGESGRSSI